MKEKKELERGESVDGNRMSRLLTQVIAMAKLDKADAELPEMDASIIENIAEGLEELPQKNRVVEQKVGLMVEQVETKLKSAKQGQKMNRIKTQLDNARASMMADLKVKELGQAL